MLNKPITDKQAIEYLSNKKITPTNKTSAEIVAGWSDKAKAQAFFSAQVTKADVLEDMRKRITQVIEGKGTAQQARWWMREFLTTEGQSALREMGFLATEEDMNDNNRLSELGSTRRLKLIIEQNARNARAASEYDGFLETKSVYPYVEYKTAGDERVRDNHDKFKDNVYEVGTPEMRRVYPPNDFHCRCRFRQLRADEVGNRKIQRSAPPANELSSSGFSFDPAIKPEPLAAKKKWQPDVAKSYAGVEKMTPEMRKTAKARAKDKFTGQVVKNVFSEQEIIMSYQGAKHTISQIRTNIGIDLLNSAFDIAENGKPKGFTADKNKRQNVKGVWKFEKKVPTRAGMILAELVVRETVDGMLFYHVQGIKPSGQA